MIPSDFQYFAPSSVAEATALLSRYRDEAKVLAGGHSLLPLMKLRLLEPKYLIDIGRIEDLAYIREADGGLAIGAMTTYWMLESSDLVRRRAPSLVEAVERVADVQVRNMGTIGGSLAHADPAGDLPAVILVLNGQLTANTRRASRTIGIDRFFVDLLTTALRPTEILTEIRIPSLAPRTGTSYQKFDNKASHYAVVGVAAVVTLDSDGVCQQARVAVTGAGPKAVRARRSELILRGKRPDDAVIRRAASRAGAGIDFLEDIHASTEYRAHLTAVFAERAIREAVARAR